MISWYWHTFNIFFGSTCSPTHIASTYLQQQFYFAFLALLDFLTVAGASFFDTLRLTTKAAKITRMTTPQTIKMICWLSPIVFNWSVMKLFLKKRGFIYDFSDISNWIMLTYYLLLEARLQDLFVWQSPWWQNQWTVGQCTVSICNDILCLGVTWKFKREYYSLCYLFNAINSIVL